MTNIGWATMSVLPSFRGFQSAVNRGTLGAASLLQPWP